MKKKDKSKVIIYFIILSILVVGLSYIIFNTNLLEPRINQITASYISLNNKNTTDMMKITNISKQRDKKGRSILNKKYLEFVVNNEDNLSYNILIYPLKNETEEDKVRFYVKGSEGSITKSLSEVERSTDGGFIVYQGRKKSKILIKMWVGRNYQKEVGTSLFEIRIKPNDGGV